MGTWKKATNDAFLKAAKEIAAKWFNENTEKWYKDELSLTPDDIDIATFASTTNNWAATLFTDKPTRTDWLIKITMEGDDLKVRIDPYKKQDTEFVDLKSYGFAK